MGDILGEESSLLLQMDGAPVPRGGSGVSLRRGKGCLRWGWIFPAIPAGSAASQPLEPLSAWEVLRGAEAEERKGQQGEAEELGTKEGGQGGEKGALPTHPCHFRYCWENHCREMRINSASIHFESMLFQRQAAYAICTLDFSNNF